MECLPRTWQWIFAKWQNAEKGRPEFTSLPGANGVSVWVTPTEEAARRRTVT